MASLMFFFMSSIFCFRSLRIKYEWWVTWVTFFFQTYFWAVRSTYSSLNPFTCNILICFTIVLLPDSPAPSSSNRWVALKWIGEKGKQFLVSLTGIASTQVNQLITWRFAYLFEFVFRFFYLLPVSSSVHLVLFGWVRHQSSPSHWPTKMLFVRTAALKPALILFEFCLG